MSVESKSYLIYGYNLTGLNTDKFDDWQWSNDGEEYTCDQIRGNVQLFTDPMCGCHLYLGYIFANIHAFEGDTHIISDDDLAMAKETVPGHLNHLQELGVISNEFNQKPELILFEECS